MLVYCATTNPGKLREFQLAFQGSGVTLENLPSLAQIPAPDENGATFGENAALKAVYYSQHAPGLVFADDSGLEVDALEKQPGVYSARYAGLHASDDDNNRLVLEKMRGISDRAARFVCAVALASTGRLLQIFTGVVEGVLLDAPRGSNGFGYDPLFYYPPFSCSFGEAPLERKMQVSHRSQALRAMLAYLQTGASSGSTQSSFSHR